MPGTANVTNQNDEWKIEKRKPGCFACGRAFASEEAHVSGIVEAEGRFTRRDYCSDCFGKGGEPMFSHWITTAPKRGQRTIEDIAAMTDFFKKLVEKPAEDATREKVVYLTALLLMRKKRLKNLGTVQRDGRPRVRIEKSWDGETIEIADPPIGETELEQLKAEMEALFRTEIQ